MKFSIYLYRRVFVMSRVPTYRSKAVPLLSFFLVCMSVVSYLEFVLSLFVPHLSFFWCLGKTVFRDCGIILVSSLVFLMYRKANEKLKNVVFFFSLWKAVECIHCHLGLCYLICLANIPLI